MIDLHTHSTHSDGTKTPSELLKLAKEKNINVLAITDHDNCNAYNELKTIDINIEVANIPLKSMSSGEQSIIRIYSIFANKTF